MILNEHSNDMQDVYQNIENIIQIKHLIYWSLLTIW